MLDAEVFRYAIAAFAALTGLIVLEGVYSLFFAGLGKKRAINRRMRLGDGAVTQKEVLVQLRKERGLDDDPGLFSITKMLQQLRIQANMQMPVAQYVGITTSISIAFGMVLGNYFDRLVFGIIVGSVLSIVLPIMILRFRRKRRHKQFGQQLPEALELITRGLKAGHPVPIAISMVAREMADPIGTEFGIMSDEVTYGSDMVTALQQLYDRVGHEDLPLFVTAVAIQSSTGGSLRETLDGLSTVIRDRAKLRRKIRAISAEGRLSAYILTAVPVLLVAALMLLSPDYYGDVMDEPLTWQLVGAGVFWLLVGNAIMFKLASFKI